MDSEEFLKAINECSGALIEDVGALMKAKSDLLLRINSMKRDYPEIAKLLKVDDFEVYTRIPGDLESVKAEAKSKGPDGPLKKNENLWKVIDAAIRVGASETEPKSSVEIIEQFAKDVGKEFTPKFYNSNRTYLYHAVDRGLVVRVENTGKKLFYRITGKGANEWSGN